jgi:uncharacterized coiled-coil DUF342 family protein
MANGHGGKRPGAGRKKKMLSENSKPPADIQGKNENSSLEETLNRLMTAQTNNHITSEEFKKLAHEVAYMRQELEFIKKIILVSAGGKPK